MFETPSSAEQVKTESRRLLAQTNDLEARELARRLSLITGSFQRQFAIDLALSAPAISEPGKAFEALVGPWIQPIAEDYFTVSPVLFGYALAEVGQTKIAQYWEQAAAAWLQQKSVNAANCVETITAALLGNSETLLTRIVVSLINAKTADFNRNIALVSPLQYFRLPSPISKRLSPDMAHLFRRLQMRVAAIEQNWKQYQKLDEQAVAEIQSLRQQDTRDRLSVVHAASTVSVLDSRLPTAMRIERTFAAIHVVFSGRFSKDGAPNSFKKQIVKLALIASAAINRADDLRSFLEHLEGASSEERRAVLSAMDEKDDIYGLIIDGVWLEESNQEQPDWKSTLQVFVRATKVAEECRNQSLYANAVRGSMVVYDEYLNDPNAALSLALTARTTGHDHPLIDVAESVVEYHRRNYLRSLDLIERAETRSLPSSMRSTRIFAMARALGCVHALGAPLRLNDADRMAMQGIRLGASKKRRTFFDVARVAFGVERAWIALERGDHDKAGAGLFKAIGDLENIPDQNNKVLRALRKRLGHCLLWLSTPGGSIAGEPIARPRLSFFANFDAPPDDLLNLPNAPYEGMWAQLGHFAAKEGNIKRAKKCLARALESNDGLHSIVGATLSSDLAFFCDLLDGKFRAALVSGIEHVRIISLGNHIASSEQANSESTLVRTLDLDKDFDLYREQITPDWINQIPPLAILPMVMSFSIAKRRPTLEKCCSHLERMFGKIQLLADAVRWAEIGFRATVGSNEEATAYARSIVLNRDSLPEPLRLFPIAICAASKGVPLVEALFWQQQLLGIAARLPGTAMSEITCLMISNRWLTVAKEQPFSLRNRWERERLLDAAGTKLIGVRECAALLLIAAEAIHVRWPPEGLQTLQSLAGGPHFYAPRSA
jgi:tetratricopeptide (TPR) repeat protein